MNDLIRTEQCHFLKLSMWYEADITRVHAMKMLIYQVNVISINVLSWSSFKILAPVTVTSLDFVWLQVILVIRSCQNGNYFFLPTTPPTSSLSYSYVDLLENYTLPEGLNRNSTILPLVTHLHKTIHPNRVSSLSHLPIPPRSRAAHFLWWVLRPGMGSPLNFIFFLEPSHQHFFSPYRSIYP